MLTLAAVHKSFGNKEVLHNIHLHIDRPCIYGLIGPNGAGKTTLIRLLCGLLTPDSGTVTLSMRRQNIAYMPEQMALYMDMSVRDFLIYFGQLRHISRTETLRLSNPLIQDLHLEKEQHTKIRRLSKGTQRKVQFISLLLAQPEVLILDEPFSGLDPISAERIETELIQLKNEGKIILLSTHRMEHAELFCNHIFMLKEGRKIIDDPLEAIQMAYLQPVYEVHVRQALQLDPIPHTQDYNGIYYKYTIHYSDSDRPLWSLITAQTEDILLFRQMRPSLKEIFFQHLSA